jgi:pimeloyl-[acyl-carrier protein] methyl ester esterase
MIGFIFCHGWGLDKSFWKNILPYFRDYPYLVWDLGYFGDPDIIIPDNQDSIAWIGIGHSLGFSKLLQYNIKFKAIIGLQAFTNFLSNNLVFKKIRLKLIEKMIIDIKVDYIKTLQNFYSESGISFDYLFDKKINLENLSNDLDQLRTNENNLTCNIPCLIIASNGDKIVPSILIKDNFTNSNYRIIVHEGNTHSLGYIYSEFVFKHIMKFIHI